LQRGDFTDKTFDEAIAGIRTAERGVEVREDIAQGMEYVKQYAEEVTGQQQAALQAAQTATGAASTAAEKAAAAAESESMSKTAAANADKSAQSASADAKSAGSSAASAEESANRAAAIVSTDKTLSIEGAPADAKATGDALAEKVGKDVILDSEGNVIFYSKTKVDALLKAMQTTLQQQISAASAITASGNGYIRFSDGTQICWNTAKLTDRSTYHVFAFPVPFIDTTYAVAGMKTSSISDTDSNNFYVNKKTTDRVEIKGAYNRYNDDPYSTLIVIGRWK
jgi:hypothetical protein